MLKGWKLNPALLERHERRRAARARLVEKQAGHKWAELAELFPEVAAAIEERFVRNDQ